MIVIDSLGYADLGFRNDKEIDTPNLDALADRGLKLERYYVHTACSPSRAALMTGRYAHHTGVHDSFEASSNLAVESDEVFLSEQLKDAGYATHMIGKWHLGHHKWEYLPTYRGFDSFYGFLTDGGCYYMGRSTGNFKTYRFWFHYLEMKAPKCNVESCVRIPWEAQNQYSTENLSNKAVQAISRHAESFSDKPLFLYLAYQGVAAGFPQPNQVPPHFAEPYAKRIKSPTRRQFAAMLSALDQGIGNVTHALQLNGFNEDNTLIIISTDTGGPVDTEDAVGSSNQPLRGGRHSLFEGGVRGTAFLAGYGVSTKNRSVYKGLMHIADWFATIADVAGFPIKSSKRLDSLSHWTHLSGSALDATSAVRSEVVLGNVSESYGTGFAMIVDEQGTKDESATAGPKQWKIVAGSAGYPFTWSDSNPQPHQREKGYQPPSSKSCKHGYCLYELLSDPYEQNDLATDPAYTNVLANLRTKLHAELETSHTIVPDCTKAPVEKYEQHVVHVWYPYCDDTSHSTFPTIPI
ncbi:Arylsulfatase B [Hondaea fermentalgiana]|uniref:Arylsulfatase B n=1 Tax=Hondaea fermentalgiana TaxID=2315210 RepID=A0A2R5G1Y4_9STRA|nr:Arylsulfatase B [Hondaea fermentalgiana]|eukprot:GBG25002.1 Arylsulfatase B [Hondaea fermentalgiana]